MDSLALRLAELMVAQMEKTKVVPMADLSDIHLAVHLETAMGVYLADLLGDLTVVSKVSYWVC